MVSSRLFAVVLALAFISQASAMSCVNPEGNPVDWWIMLKGPMQLMFWPNENMQDYGLNYGYIDSENYASWTAEEFATLENENSSFMRTLYQIQQANPDEYMAMYWNDQPPFMHWTEYWAHSKGFLATDAESGFFFTHSAPHFPEFHPQTGLIDLNLFHSSRYFGQHFSCWSMAASELEKLSVDIKLNNPWVYNSNFPAAFATEFPNLHTLSKIITESDPKDPPKLADAHTSNKYHTLTGREFTYFAHNGKAPHDFYEQFVEPGLETGLMVQSWGRPWMPNFNPTVYGYESTNVAFIWISRDQKFHWESDKDHSKWGVSYNSEKPYVCMCDNNRMVSQRVRGGGCSCFEDYQLWERFHGLVKFVAATEVEPAGYNPPGANSDQTF